MAKHPLLGEDKNQQPVTFSVTANNELFINIHNANKYNKIVYTQENNDINTNHWQTYTKDKENRLQSIAMAYYQYQNSRIKFANDDYEMRKYGRENFNKKSFDLASKHCRDIYEENPCFSIHVFTGITAIVLECGYEKQVAACVDRFLHDYEKIMSGGFNVADVIDGDPVSELCCYLYRWASMSKGIINRESTAKITISFWNHILEGAKMKQSLSIIVASPFMPLHCCPPAKMLKGAEKKTA